jgi:hypothetical protein
MAFMALPEGAEAAGAAGDLAHVDVPISRGRPGRIPSWPGNPPRHQAQADAAEFRRLRAQDDAATDRAARRPPARAAPSRSRSPRVGSARSSWRVGGFTADDGAGFLLALIAYGPALAWITGGSANAAKWFRAKFLNEDNRATDPSNLRNDPGDPHQAPHGAGPPAPSTITIPQQGVS